MLFEPDEYDKTVARFENRGGYQFRIVAGLGNGANAQYHITIEEPEENTEVGYMATLEQFSDIGLLLMAFSKFAEDKIRVNDLNRVEREVIYRGLTRKTIIRYAKKHGLLKEFLRMLKQYDD